MRYFFNFVTGGHSAKFDGKELFYMRLLNKRMGKTYTLHKNCDFINHYHPPQYNMFNGYIIEFNDEAAYAKFKLGFRKLFNPNLNYTRYVQSIVSFKIDDDFVQKCNDMHENFLSDQQRYSQLYRFRSMAGTVLSIHEMKNDIQNFPTLKYHDEKTDSINEFINSFIENLSKFSFDIDLYKFDKFNSDISSYHDRYIENYKNNFIDVQKHEI